jgi:Fic family protein
MDSETSRAGQYIMQIAGYKAFSPKPLPPDPPLQIDDETLTLLSNADMAVGRLDGVGDLLPNPDLFVSMYVNKEAVLSSQIEGTQASLIDVLAFESAAAEPENPQDIEEVVHYVAALNYGLQRLDSLSLSLRLIREIHEILLAGVRGADRRPCEFRTSQNWIGHLGATIQTAGFVPPPPQDMTIARRQLEQHLHTDSPLPILPKIGLAHAQFETIHPFLDGNGRMGRQLITFLLCQRQGLRRPLLYLSYYFHAHKSEYYAHLQNMRDEGDWESWLKFFLTGAHEVAREATTTTRAIIQLRGSHRALIAREFRRASGAGAVLLEFLYKRPIVTVKSVMETTQHSFANANQLVGRFVDHGILREMTHQARNRRFIYADYVQLLAPEELHRAVSQEPTQPGLAIEQTHSERAEDSATIS